VSKAPRQIFGRLHGDPLAFRRFRVGQAVRIYTNGVWAKGHVTQITDLSLEVRAPLLGAGEPTYWRIYDARNAVNGHGIKEAA
jgi:hypothetical protein